MRGGWGDHSLTNFVGYDGLLLHDLDAAGLCKIYEH